MVIYYNPDCSKCRQAVELLESAHCDFEVRNYLAEPPSVDELRDLVALLGCAPFDIVRTSEPLYMEKFSGQEYSGDEWLHILSENPLLIQRPIVVSGQRAMIGRPVEKIISLI